MAKFIAKPLSITRSVKFNAIIEILNAINEGREIEEGVVPVNELIDFLTIEEKRTHKKSQTKADIEKKAQDEKVMTKIVAFLTKADKPMKATEIWLGVPIEDRPSSVSKTTYLLRQLIKNGLIVNYKQGKNSFYSVC